MKTDRLIMPYLERADYETAERNRRVNIRVVKWIEDKINDRALRAEREESEIRQRRALASYQKRASADLKRVFGEAQ